LCDIENKASHNSSCPWQNTKFMF